MKPILTALALCTFLAPAIAQPTAATAPVAVANPNVKSVETDFGWTITPVILPEDNAATMLGMKFWRFNVESPDETLRGAYKLQLRPNGETPITIHEGQFSVGGGNAEMTFGLMPIGDKPLWEADEMKFSALFRNPTSTSSINKSALLTVCKNPIKDIKFDTTIAGYAGTGDVNADGSIILTRFLEGNIMAGRTLKGGSQLVLVLTVPPKAE